MAQIKPLTEQTLMNNYVFSMVMREPKRIKPLLEHILDIKIKSIRIAETEKSMKERFESKGIRLDLYIKDSEGAVYDVEVQTSDQKNLPQRMRYYQAMLDLTFFPAGADYNEMRKSYVIFICNFDPYSRGRYIYTFERRCIEEQDLPAGDEARKVVVNTKGIKGDISPELKEAVIYLDREEITGPYSQELDDAVNALKSSEERRQEYMMLMTYMAEQKASGKYIAKVEQIRKWMNKQKKLSMEETADAIDVSVSVFEEVLSLIKEHPEWDDEDIADRTDWRKK